MPNPDWTAPRPPTGVGIPVPPMTPAPRRDP